MRLADESICIGPDRRARQLSQHRRHHLRRRAHRQRGDPSRLRLPRREPVLRRHLPGLRPHLHRPLAGGDPPHGRQGPGPRDRQAGRGAGGARQRGAAARTRTRRSSVADAAGYPVILKAAAGGGGRGMRIVRSRAEVAAGVRRLPGRGRRGLRLLGDLLEKYIEERAARRGAGARRQERHARAPGRARLLGPASPPEAGRGIAAAGAAAGDAAGPAQGRPGRGRRGELRQRRHRGVPGRTRARATSTSSR